MGLWPLIDVKMCFSSISYEERMNFDKLICIDIDKM